MGQASAVGVLKRQLRNPTLRSHFPIGTLFNMTDEAEHPSDVDEAKKISNGDHPKKPSEADKSRFHKDKSKEYNGFHFIADLTASLAWPLTTILLFLLIASNASAIIKSVNEFMETQKSLEVQAGPKEGLVIKIVAREVQSGLSQQAATKSGSIKPGEVAALNDAALNAASQIVPQNMRRSEKIIKVLWVDDHPQNNIGLQYAFQALGIVVIAIDSDDGLNEAFSTAGNFDVVITDVSRDGVRGKSDDPEAGLQTVAKIRAKHPAVPVIIYSSSYAATHTQDKLTSPVIAITSDTQRVFTLVTDIATKRAKQ